MSERSTHILHVHGMHCAACVVLTETELQQHPGVRSARSSLVSRTVEITGEFNSMTAEEIASELSGMLSQHALSTVPEESRVRWNEFAFALPLALAMAFLFIVIQKLGIINIVNTSDVTYGTAFVIGMVASLSTCMAVVGGLVLSMSATFGREGDRVRPQVLFHGGRIVSFFILGGVIGAIGRVFQVGIVGTVVLGVIIGLVMIVMGLNLLDIFSWSKRLQPAMPKFISRRALRLTTLNHTFTPAVVGIVTFFLPCGFTQSMQIYTLSTGSFMRGGLTMLSFALGTLPVLALLSVGTSNISKVKKSGVFFKTIGLVVILFGILNIVNSAVLIGWIPPLFNL